MQLSGSDSRELRNLRRTMRDLVALSTLPAVWVAAGPDGIARSLADVLVKTLGLDLVYIQLRGPNPDGIIEVARHRHRPDLGSQTAVVAQAVAPLLTADTYDAPPAIQDPLGSGMLQNAVIRFGHMGDHGVLVAGSQRPDFPNEADRLLLGIGANQTAIVIQRKRAEQALQKEQEWLRVTLASIGDAVIATDMAGCVTFMNGVAEELTGWTQDDAAGLPLSTVFPIVNADSRQVVENPVEKVLREGIVVGLANHTVLIARDGTERPIDDSAAPIRDQAGAIMGVVLVFRDVSERQRLERENAKRAAGARLLAAIVESSDDAIVSKTLDGTIQTWNVGAERIFGYTAEQAIGRHISLIIPPERITEEDLIISRLRAGERVDHFETVRLRSDGRHVHVSLTISPIKDDTGKVVGASKIARDITERRQAEQERREHEQQFRTLVEQVKDYAIFLMDRQGRPTSWNEGVRRVLGFEESEFIGADVIPIIFTPEDQEAGIPQQELHEAATTGTAGNDRWMRHKDGTRFFANGTTTALKDDSGSVIGFMKVMRDQTEQRRLEEELRQIAADLSAADRRKTEFLATLGHELRNPLAPIRTGLEVMKLSKDDPQLIEETRGMMERQAQQLVRLIDDLLDVSRITQGKLQLRTSQVNLAEVVQSAVESARPFVDEAHHELTVTLPPQPIRLEADPNRLAQVFSNLLNNSAKYTPEGGRIWLTVEVVESGEAAEVANSGSESGSPPSALRPPLSVVVTVRDSGIGIPADMQTGIFEMFTQIDRPWEKGYKGLGIGLTLVKRLVEMHHGRIEVSSSGLNQGSEFRVRLPIRTESQRDEQQPEPEEIPAPTTQLRILVVDDNTAAADMLSLVVKMLGHEVRTAYDGSQGVAAAEEFRPDVVLMDLGMPKMNGYEAARYIREQPWGQSVNLIALTGWGQDDDRRQTREAGFDHHLIKPVEPSTLRNLLAEYQS